eukprot:UN08178
MEWTIILKIYISFSILKYLCLSHTITTWNCFW